MLVRKCMICDYEDEWESDDEEIVRASCLPCGHQGCFTLDEVSLNLEVESKMNKQKAEMWRGIARQIRKRRACTTGYYDFAAWFDSKKDARDFRRACIEYCKKREREEEKRG